MEYLPDNEDIRKDLTKISKPNHQSILELKSYQEQDD